MLLSFNFYKSRGQSFAPDGAVWYYTEIFAFSSDTSFIEVKVIGDTMINATWCKHIEADSSCLMSGSIYTYSSGDSVFVYDQLLDSFQLIYDFSTQAGDSWSFLILQDTTMIPDTFTVFIDSATSITINGLSLTKQFVSGYSTSGLQNNYASEVIENIGDINYLFYPVPYQNIVCDINFPVGLRCYKDDSIGVYDTGRTKSCTYENIVGLSMPSQNPKASIWPSPASSELNIESKYGGIREIKFYDLRGRLVFQMVMPNSPRQLSLNISSISPGMYVTKILFETGDLISTSFFKN